MTTAQPIPSVLVKPTKEFGKEPDVGRSKRYAREDHDHGAPDLSTVAVTDVLPFSDTVSTQKQFFSASTPGISTQVSRADHNHGTPDFDPESKQDVLESGVNIKTVNGQSLLGSGDLTIAGGSGGNSYFPGGW